MHHIEHQYKAYYVRFKPDFCQRCETLEEASNWKKVNHAGQDNIRIRTKPEARVKTEDEKF